MHTSSASYQLIPADARAYGDSRAAFNKARDYEEDTSGEAGGEMENVLKCI